MKIFINTTNWAIVKTENEFPSVVGDNYVDTLKVYYDVNPSTALIYPTITLLKPNGRKVGAFPFDPETEENSVPYTYVDADSNTWYGFTFTLSSDDGQLTSVGKYQVTITTNKYKVVGTAPNESSVITAQRNTNIQLEVLNAVINDNQDILILGDNADDVIASFSQIIETLQNDYALIANGKADRDNNSQNITGNRLYFTELYSNDDVSNELRVSNGDAELYLSSSGAVLYETTNTNMIKVYDNKIESEVGTNKTTLNSSGFNVSGNDFTSNTDNVDMQVATDNSGTNSIKITKGTYDSDNDEYTTRPKIELKSTDGDIKLEAYEDVIIDANETYIPLGVEIGSTESNDSLFKFDPTIQGTGNILKVDTGDYIPFEISKNNIVQLSSLTKIKPVTVNGTAYDIQFQLGGLYFNKNGNTQVNINPEYGLVVLNDLLNINPVEYMSKTSSFKVGVETGSDTGTFVKFDNPNSRIDFITANTSSDKIYLNNVKLTNKTYVDSADNNLQSQIDGLNAGQNLADIVADLTALNNLSITNLKNGDKVQVLVDSNHDDASTVYKLVISGSSHSWSYIGKYGQDGYTKAEANALLALKADLTNTDQTITADKVKVNEIRDLAGSGKVYTKYDSGYIESNVENPNDSSNRSFVRISKNNAYFNSHNSYGSSTMGIYNYPYAYNSQVDAYNSIETETYLSLNKHFDAFCRYDSDYYNEFYANKDYAEMSSTYTTSEDVAHKLRVSYNNGLQHIEQDILGNTTTSTIIDTNNATTELFLTDAEMTTLLSEVFD